MALAPLEPWSSCAIVSKLALFKVCPNFWGSGYSVHIILLKSLFSATSSIIICVICRSAKKYVHGEVDEENAETNVFYVCTWAMSGNWKLSTVLIEISSYFGKWNWCDFWLNFF